MKRTLLALGIVALVLSFCSYGFAENFDVATSDDFRAALLSADSNSENDTITLDAGTYHTGWSYFYYYDYQGISGNLTIIGSGDVILDGGGTSQVLNIYSASSADITLQNLTLQSGDAGDYGGGANIYLFEGNLNVVGCSFKDNESTGGYYGGGLYTYVGNENGDGTTNIINCDFTDNNASDSYNYGGGLYATSYGDINVANSSFSGNSCTEDGGGVYIYPYGNINLTNCTFTNNNAPGSGGGAYLYPCYNGCMVTGNEFSSNSASYGGGIYLAPYDVTSLMFSNNLVTDNTSSGNGGGAYFDAYYDVENIEIINNTITGNVVSEAFDDGGGIYVYCSDYNSDGSTVSSIYNNILWNNSASDGDDIYLDDGGYPNSFDLYNNDYSVLSTDFTGESTLDKDLNLNVDPDFVSATDYRLEAGSPVIDMGDLDAPSLPSTDLDGNARVYGDNVDMGAYEYAPAGDDDDDISTSSSGNGGCNTGAFVPSVLMLLAPLFILARKR